MKAIVCSNDEVIVHRTQVCLIELDHALQERERIGNAYHAAAAKVLHAAGIDFDNCGSFAAYNGGNRSYLVEMENGEANAVCEAADRAGRQAVKECEKDIAEEDAAFAQEAENE